MKNSSSDFSFLQGNGEVIELIRQHDWSNSSLGDPDQWPQSLRTTLSIVINSKFPMILFWGPEHILFYNDAFRPGLGNTGKHPAIGKKAAAVLPENWSQIKSILDRILAGGESTWLEEQLRPVYRNGKTQNVYWTFSHSAVNDESGNVAGVLTIGSETTDKVETIQKLHLSNERFKNLVREATVGIIVLIGEQMIVEVVNQSYGQLIDRTEEELIGKPLFDIIPEATDPFLSILQNVRVTGTPLYLYDQPYFVYTDGIKKEGYLNIVYMPFRESDGTITGVMALCHDVTQQVIARKKTEEAEERTRLSIKAAELGVYEVHLPTNEVSVSDRFLEIFDVDKNSERKDFVNVIHEDDRQLRKEANEIALKTGLLEYEARIVRQNGEVRWIRATGNVYYDEHKIPVRLLGVIQDITREKNFSDELSRQVEERTKELKAINQELEQFAYAASHDLQEPLRKVTTFTNLILERNASQLNDSGKIYLSKIDSSVNRMKMIIDDLLQYSYHTKTDQQSSPVDLNQIVAEIETDLELLIQEKNATITKTDLPVLSAVPSQMNQLFQNVISNSLKFSRKEIACQITIVAQTLSQEEISQLKNLNPSLRYVEIKVSDNGVGFPQQYADNIFGLFKRLHDKTQYEGTGIGLSLCKKIVQNHKGEIHATSNPDEGTTMHIILPIE